jgi:ABC-type siderophore export system fused ATPase/permease subunit
MESQSSRIYEEKLTVLFFSIVSIAIGLACIVCSFLLWRDEKDAAFPLAALLFWAGGLASVVGFVTL